MPLMYYFKAVQNAGYYIVNYISIGNEYLKSKVFFATDASDLYVKWKEFCMANGLKFSSISFVELA